MDDHYRAAPLASNLPALMGLLNVWNATFMVRAAGTLPRMHGRGRARAVDACVRVHAWVLMRACHVACVCAWAGEGARSPARAGLPAAVPLTSAAHLPTHQPHSPAHQPPPPTARTPVPQGRATCAILPYQQALQHFAPHIQQLSMESNGKGVGLDGAPLGFESGERGWWWWCVSERESREGRGGARSERRAAAWGGSAAGAPAPPPPHTPLPASRAQGRSTLASRGRTASTRSTSSSTR